MMIKDGWGDRLFIDWNVLVTVSALCPLAITLLSAISTNLNGVPIGTLSVGDGVAVGVGEGEGVGDGRLVGDVESVELVVVGRDEEVGRELPVDMSVEQEVMTKIKAMVIRIVEMILFIS
jgi:hypothetical protein